MKFKFNDPRLEEVYYDRSASLGYTPAIDKGFRKVIGFISQAHTELDLREMKGLHYHKLKGDRKHQHGLDITDQWRLIVERIRENRELVLLIISVENYHT